MDISNIPNEFHKEIIDKDGQKIVFDFKDLDKSKEEYIRLTQDEYGKLKEYATKRKRSIRLMVSLELYYSSLVLELYFILIHGGHY